MKKPSMAQQAIYSTVKLTAFKNGNIIGTGTGFFFHFDEKGDSSCPAIVTNKHVIAGADEIRARCHLSHDEGGRPSGQFVNFIMQLHTTTIIYHPNNDIDLCALMIGTILQQGKDLKKPVFYVPLGINLIPSRAGYNKFDDIENVTMIGCPNGISDEVNNVPIVRRGITATSLTRNYNDKPEFVVDMACFPGSSGSPIFVMDQAGYFDHTTNQYLMGANRFYLVGILYAGPMITNTGAVILAHPPKVEVAAMMHLGYAVKAAELFAMDEFIKKTYP